MEDIQRQMANGEVCGICHIALPAGIGQDIIAENKQRLWMGKNPLSIICPDCLKSNGIAAPTFEEI